MNIDTFFNPKRDCGTEEKHDLFKRLELRLLTLVNEMKKFEIHGT